ncbi:transglycosylase domain-containing protein [Pseudolysinimonas yzui]|uniref:Carboxypeptidase n=1 Tax=Pseudolysinimonas yzui TaxID=2708254 RepID=A0A8J3GQG4_9MICO|nr:transglycosylase domain-containing protein [Pseudolysinimonas yzui]GHF14444.1 carboxypeptidase [Pseudolysinimonas yzui]
MPAQKTTATSLFTAILGTLGFSALAGVLVTVMIAPAIAVTGVTASNTVGIFNSLPEYIQLDPGSQQNTIAVRNADGTLTNVATIYKQNREEKTLDEISDYLECAAVAGEDRRFYEHGGVDLPSLVRAAIGQVTGDDGAGGASTLSMQTVRNILQQQALNDDSLTEEARKKAIQDALDPTLDRKIKEMKLAIGLEKNYTKDEILQGYLNIAGFGGNTYGVQAAANQYFSVDAADVTIAQAASLLAIVQYPNLRDLSDPEHYAANQDRRDVILTAMEDYGCITKAERDEAIAIPVDENFVLPSPSSVGCRSALQGYGYVCDYALHVVDELEALGGSAEEREQAWDRGGYQLVLTIHPDLQAAAWSTVHQWAPSNETRFALGAVATSVEVGSGKILTMAQNKTFDDSLEPADPQNTNAVNLASDVAHGGSQGFQPGSTYKPYVLLAFLAAGHGVNESYNASIREVNQAEFTDTCDPYYNAEGVLQGPPWGGIYKFRNDSNESGSYNIVRGTAGSVNSIFIQMAKAVDQCDIAKIADSIGVHDASGAERLMTRPSCSIGGCENNIAPLTQAAAYAAIANQGIFCEPIMIDAVIDPTGNSQPGQKQECGQSPLVSPGVANTAAYAMAAVMGGTGSASNPNDGTPYIGKTGTTDESVHTWMVGSSTRVATAVWVGNITGKQAMRNIRVNGTSGGLLRHRIFRPIAQAIDAVYPGGAFPGPDPALLTGSPVEVPNVIGSTLEQAKTAIELAELGFEHGGDIDSDLPAGQVAATDPAVGSGVPRGTTVRVFTSNGLAEPVPNVVGMSRNDAEDALDDAGFNVDAVCVDDEDLGNPLPPPAVDNVTSQDPPGGAMRNPGSTTVTISYYRPICP